jgi:hypothetical protein
MLKILGFTVESVTTRATRHTGFMHPCVRSRPIFRRVRKVALPCLSVHPSVRKKHFTFNLFSIFFPLNSCVYEIMWKNRLEPWRPEITI